MPPPPRGSTWMQDNLSWLKDYSIREILTIPGSHDAGMDRDAYKTFHATKDHIITQTQSIYGQLQYGARWFDIRPMTWDSDFYCGHFTNAGRTGWQGGLGEKIDDVIDDVNRFTREHKELIVLRLTHITNSADGQKMSLERQAVVLKMFYDRLEHVYKSDSAHNVLDHKLDNYVGTNGCVIVATSANPDEGNQIEDQVYRTIGRGKVDYWQDIQSCTYMQDDLAAIATSTIGRFLFGGIGSGLSVLAGTERLQEATFPTAPQSLVVTTGGQSLAKKGYVFQSDNIRDDAAMNICLAASHVQWRTATANNTASKVVAVYGGKLITDRGILDNISHKVESHQVFKVENALFGEDPWSGSGKSCCIYYLESRQPNAGDGFFWRGMFAREGYYIDFATDIREISWGGKYLSGEQYRRAYAALITAKIARLPFKLDIGKMWFLLPDPLPNVRKKIVFRYTSISGQLYKDRNVWEDLEYDLGRDIDWLRYDNWVVDKPEAYAQFFDRIDGMSRASIYVSNDLFKFDPAPNMQKILYMSLQKGSGTARVEKEWEGRPWNVAGLL